MTPRQAMILEAIIAHPGMSGRALARLGGAWHGWAWQGKTRFFNHGRGRK